MAFHQLLYPPQIFCDRLCLPVEPIDHVLRRRIFKFVTLKMAQRLVDSPTQATAGFAE
jgi:hypothetical protein